MKSCEFYVNKLKRHAQVVLNDLDDILNFDNPVFGSFASNLIRKYQKRLSPNISKEELKELISDFKSELIRKAKLMRITEVIRKHVIYAAIVFLLTYLAFAFFKNSVGAMVGDISMVVFAVYTAYKLIKSVNLGLEGGYKMLIEDIRELQLCLGK